MYKSGVLCFILLLFLANSLCVGQLDSLPAECLFYLEDLFGTTIDSGISQQKHKENALKSQFFDGNFGKKLSVRLNLLSTSFHRFSRH